MKVYKTQEEVMEDVVDGVLVVDEDVSFEFSFNLPDVSLKISGDINCRNIKARDIKCRNIERDFQFD